MAIVGVVSTPAQAAPSQNSGWVYTANNSGGAYFDADLAEYAGFEKITVCDNLADGYGVEVVVDGYFDESAGVADPKADGKCVSVQGDMFTEGYPVYVHVFEYAGGVHVNRGEGTGVA